MQPVSPRLLSSEELRTEKGITYHPSQIWRLVKAGKFPAPVKFGGRGSRLFWPEEKIDAHISRLQTGEAA